MNLHFGCGLTCGAGWYNCDASPTIWLQRLPIVGALARRWLPPLFPSEAVFGNIAAGLPITEQSCDTAFSSHVLEHLALADLRSALRNTFRYLKPGGVFRMVLPDFERLVAAYLADQRVDAVSHFLRYSHLGRPERPRGLTGHLRAVLGNSYHLWMWDEKGLRNELEACGFVRIRRCQCGDAQNPAFSAVEHPDRFEDALALECFRPE